MVDERRAKEIWWEEQTRFGLHSWKFEIRDIPECGVCYFGRKLIVLSREICEWNDEDEVRDTVRHEIAHVIANDATHGPVWQAACDRVGCRPEYCGYPRVKESVCVVRCHACGFRGHTDSVPEGPFYCMKCGETCEVSKL